MIQVAVMGYRPAGSGVVEVIETTKSLRHKKSHEAMHL